MRFVLFVALGLATACASQNPRFEIEVAAAAPEEVPVEKETIALPFLGPAPELQNEIWLNTDGPLRLAELRGNVVLLDMWTFG